MNKNKRKFIAKYFLVFTILFSFIFNSVLTVRACGPYYTEVLFSFDVRPDNLKEFASGNIGILRPNYARSYLVVAYRIINDLPLSKEQQKQAVALWNYRLGIDDSESENENADNSKAMEDWYKIRDKVLGFENQTVSENDVWKQTSNQYDYYVNCTKSGFETATKTLEDRFAKYSDDSASIKEWLNGQDTVFSNCSSVGKLPNKVGNDAPNWLQKDRDYQIAAALFYAERLDEAIQHFERIAKDNSSEWNKISKYLIARTYLRKASLEKDKKEDFTRKAETHLLNLLKDENMKEIHQISRELLYIAANRAKTEERFRNFSENISSQTEIADMRRELGIYTNYLDAFGFKPEERETIEEINKRIEKQSEPEYKGEQTFWEWIWSLIFGEEISENTNKIDTTNEEIEVTKTTNDEVYDYDKPELKNSMHFRSEVDFENITETALNEDISAWIFALQANDQKAFEFSLKKWQQTFKTHWLLVAISNAETDYKETEKLIEQADKIKFDSPAFATVKYHQIRLFIEQNKFETAREKLDEFLKKDKNKMPLATQNGFFAQRMLVAKNLDEFLQFANRKAIAYSSYTSFIDETSEYGKYGEIDTREKGELLWRNRWMFDKDSAEIFNKKMPLKMLMEAGLKKNVPEYLRKEILISALTRSILLEDKNAQRKIANDLIAVAPDMSKELAAFSQTPNDLTTFKLLINYPVMQPLVDKGFGRYTIPTNSLAYDRDNWWYREELEIKKEFIDEPFVPQFLSENDLKTAESERKKIFDKGFTGEILSEKAVVAAKKFPNEKQLPELLYKTLQANRYGDIGYGEDKNRKSTKTVFQTLHNKFPKSVWAKKSPVWY